MEYTRHAGGCCGISVVHGFDDASVNDFDQIIRRHDTEHGHGSPGNRLLEAVLTDRQLDRLDQNYNGRVTRSVREAGGWAVVLAARGFQLHTRFRNSNSGRYCNVFHRVTTREPITGLRWQVPAAPVAPVDPAVPAVPDEAPVVAPPTPTPTVWSTAYLDLVAPFVGLRVQYRHRPGIGSSPRYSGREGVVTEVGARDVHVQWDQPTPQNTRPRYSYRHNRFVWDTAQLPEPVLNAPAAPEPIIPEPEPLPPEPVVTRTTQYYAIRRDGTHAGPFQTEAQARQRWTRVRRYVRVDTVTTDGVVETHETFIAA